MIQLKLTNQGMSKIGFMYAGNGEWNFLPVSDMSINLHYDEDQELWYMRNAIGEKKGYYWFEMLNIQSLDELYTVLKVLRNKFNKL